MCYGSKNFSKTHRVESAYITVVVVVVVVVVVLTINTSVTMCIRLRICKRLAFHNVFRGYWSFSMYILLGACVCV